MVYGLIAMNAVVLGADRAGRGAFNGVLFWLIVIAFIGAITFALRRSRSKKRTPMGDDWHPRDVGDAHAKGDR